MTGLLRKRHDTLVPDIFDIDRKPPIMHEDIRIQILQLAEKAKPIGSDIKAVLVLGSIVGYSYTLSSDLDISLFVSPYDPSMGKTHGAKAVNGTFAKGTKHQINFFINEWRPTTMESLSGIDFGVYDILNREWVKESDEPMGDRDPMEYFKTDLYSASMVERAFNRIADDYVRVLDAIASPVGYNLRTLEAQKAMLYKQLLAITDKVDKGRKFLYLSGWGIPRYSDENLTFKLLDHGKHEALFSELKDKLSEIRKISKWQ